MSICLIAGVPDEGWKVPPRQGPAPVGEFLHLFAESGLEPWMRRKYVTRAWE